MEQTINNNVQGWLMNVPNYRQEQYSTSKNIEIRQTRPVSVTSISSEDSVNLDELINVNFTTSMEEEADLSELSLLDLDDSKEDFWKVETIYIPSPSMFNKKPSYYRNELNDSFQKGNKQGFVNTLDTSCPTIRQYDTPDHSPSSRLRVPSLPISPKSPVSFQNKRSGSFSSETSLNSQSTITQHRSTIRPTASTSTSSFGSQSTSTSVISRSTIPIAENTIRRHHRQLSSSISENTRSTNTHLARRATHIPTAAAAAVTPKYNGSRQSIIPQRTKSTTNSRPSSQISQKRPSHIPAPQRSTTSLGMAPKGSLPTLSKPKGNNTLQRPKTRLDSTRLDSTRLDSTRSPSLRAPNTRRS
ncbi:unnamed protein product [Rhizopus stolonifer]